MSGKLGDNIDNGSYGNPLRADEITRYRRIAARANFLAQDRMDIAFATKEATRRMTPPAKDDWNKLVRIGRYFVRYFRVVNSYKYQNEFENVVACTDSEWAGCRRTRRSTSGGCIHKGQHILMFWSETQAVVALSSAEAQLGAAEKASQEVLGIMSLRKDVGETSRGHVWETQVQQVRHLNTSCGFKSRKRHMFCRTTKSEAVTTARRGSICTHCRKFECESEHGEIGNGNEEPVQDKRKNERQQNLQDHKQGTDLERRCILSDCWREEKIHH